VKVAIVTSFPQDPGSPVGGVEAVSVNLVEALSKCQGVDVHVVTLDSGLDHNHVSQWGQVRVHRLACDKRSMLLTAIRSGRRIVNHYLASLNPDVVHSHDTYGLMVKGCVAPKVFTLHGFIHEDTRVSGVKLPRLRAALWKYFETRSWSDQSHIISISPYVRERLSGIVKGRIYDIENPVAESFFLIQRSEKECNIFSAAVISPRKNTLSLVEAVATLVKEGVDIHLRLAGKVTEPSYGKAVQSRIVEYGLQEKITLLGPITTEKIQLELAQASVFALVSLEENAPLGIAEAMAAGVPVVTSNRCGMPYMVRHGETGFLVDPEEPNEIAERIRLLRYEKTLRLAMGERSRQLARYLYHPKSVAERTQLVYSEALTR
jgi:glycosyltransferase involved in cell wall biosynthesis